MRTDKASVKLGNDTLLDFQLAQIPTGVPTIVVGEAVTTHPEVVFTREDPPGSGPVAAVSAGLALTRTSRSCYSLSMPHSPCHIYCACTLAPMTLR